MKQIKWIGENQKEVFAHAKLESNGNKYSFNLDLPRSNRRTIIDLNTTQRHFDTSSEVYKSANSTAKMIRIDETPLTTYYQDKSEHIDLKPVKNDLDLLESERTLQPVFSKPPLPSKFLPKQVMTKKIKPYKNQKAF